MSEKRSALEFTAESASRVKFNEALACQQRGDITRADRVCQALLQGDPGFADAWHLRGLLAFQSARYEPGIEYIQRSLALNPLQAAALGNIGSALLLLKRPAEALERFDAALRLQGESAAILYGRSSALLDLGRGAEALAALDRALELQPIFPLALNSRGKALHWLKRHQEALRSFDRALTLSPNDFDALFSRGNVLLELRRFEDALVSYDCCVLQQPDNVELLNNRGNALRQLRRCEEALACYDRVLALKPDLAETLCNRGAALLDVDRLGEAIPCFEAALRIRPDFAVALDNQGLALLYADRPAEAVRSYSRLLEIAPQNGLARSNLFLTRSMCCDWSDYDRDCAALIESVMRGDVVQPLPFLSVSQSPALQLRCARRFVEATFEPAQNPPSWVRHGHERLRIAYVSADLRQHPVAYLMAGIFERHDRERIETIAIALQPEDHSLIGQRIKTAADRFIDVTRHGDRRVADMLRDLEIDIAVDLMGLTRWSRPGIFQQRAAPVQVNYLGYAGTMGSPAFDYLVADEIVIPAEEEQWYTEQIVRLPHCYLPNDVRRPIARVPSRNSAGLPEAGFVFCAFTATQKINPPMFDVWMRLLAQIPGSVLWLRSMGPAAVGNLRREAESRGVSAERLIIAPHVGDMAAHLSRQSLADLYLDTSPYNAHSTACDALWAGVPVLTCAGTGFASRGAASALTAVGLPELITYCIEDYEARALDLARRPEFLSGLRMRLAANGRAAPLFDTERFCRQLEAAYFTMHQQAMRGAAASGFAVTASS
jgi:protein O-GlcNAc transferase